MSADKNPAIRFALRSALGLALGACSLASTVHASDAESGQPAANGQDAAAANKAPPLYSPDNDHFFAQPYIDIDEWRDAPVRHHYIHGGFKGTDTRFSFYFPAKEQYQGHFFQLNTPIPDNENLAQKAPNDENNMISFAIASGAYFVETNGGGKFDLGKVATSKADPTISAYRANAASAAYSRIVARKIYGTDQRPFGYGFGGSGGAFRTIGSFENTTGVWDGVVPFVMGSNMAIPNMFTVRIRAMRILGPKLDQVVSAADPGGSGDIYAGLTPLEADALREVTQMGFRPESWFGWRTMGIHGLSALYPGIAAMDPSYFTDFWTKPGYLGHDHPEQFEGARLQFTSKVAGVLTAADAVRAHINIDASSEQQRGGVDTAFRIPDGAEGARIAAYRLAGKPPEVPFLGGDLIVATGAAKGKRLALARIVGDVAVLGTVDSDVAKLIKPEDEVTIDNSAFLALETYHRHQVPDASYKVWDQFRKPDGSPIYPQRPMLLGPLFVMGTGGSILSGKWSGKMIVVESLWDREALPWQADWYRGQVRNRQGNAADQNFRVWYTDHALHGEVEGPSRIVSYWPIVQQALRDLSAWVEKGVVPPTSTNYQVDNGQVKVAAVAANRLGVQPVVTLRVNGGERIEIAAGQSVKFNGIIDVPPSAGTVVAARWDFDGQGKFPEESAIPHGKKSVKVQVTHRFDTPGTYFVALKGISQRKDDPKSPFARIENLGRVRVVVK